MNPPAGPGKKRLALDAVKRGQILALVTMGCSRRVAARYVGCSPTTIYNTAKRDAGFAAELQRARSSPEVFYLRKIQKAADKEQYWRAAAWALERTMPEKYARRGPDVITVEQIAQLLGQMAQIVVAEVPARYRKAILRQFDALSRSLRAAPPAPLGRKGGDTP